MGKKCERVCHIFPLVPRRGIYEVGLGRNMSLIAGNKVCRALCVQKLLGARHCADEPQ